ncbi:MAG: bifunctional diaminohydroxyphosphoribosylaminopyrimidine deaminase/5-amino-6-(5-phosphoribosylamino)uracil reductase RibD [Nitrospinae bacterium]|nr:bifunctional diaminohydroxyphosphoribosylaminopyrimidine deaminase/5-amino-6-(5-phosphoribosylamino)uracil reductase RibD [Nitrospinota bacterium]
MDSEVYMSKVIDLALEGKGKTSPNPIVGAIIVNDSVVVGRGYHKKGGDPHAEINALRDAGEMAKGGTLYVNLEPCCHYGKTPPCTTAIIKSGIERVVIGMRDPNRLVSGRGIEELRSAGIRIEVGILEERCRKINEIYVKYITTGRPFIIMKVASSLDGKIATCTGESRWITCKGSREVVHKMRGEVDAVMVGLGTIIKDDPQLTVRMGEDGIKDPKRIILDSSLNIPLKSKVLTMDSRSDTIIVTTEMGDSERIKILEGMGVRVLMVDGKDQRVDLDRLMVRLGEMEVTSVLIEGGAEVYASALETGIVDKIILFLSPKIIGGVNAPGIVGRRGIESLDEAIPVKDIHIQQIGDDIMIEGYLRGGKRG